MNNPNRLLIGTFLTVPLFLIHPAFLILPVILLIAWIGALRQTVDPAPFEAPKPSRRQLEKERVKQMDREGVAYCPRCHSTSLSANKKGFGVGKAVVGAFFFNLPGLMAGNINARKVRVTCIKCGYQFWAGRR